MKILVIAPCPFCAERGTTKRPHRIEELECGGFYRVECWCCMAAGPVADYPLGAAKRWSKEVVWDKRSRKFTQRREP